MDSNTPTAITKYRDLSDGRSIYLVYSNNRQQVGRLTTTADIAGEWARANNLEWFFNP